MRHAIGSSIPTLCCVVVLVAGTARAGTRVSVPTDEPSGVASDEPSGETALVRFGTAKRASVDQVAIVLVREPSRLRATITFRLATRSRDALDLRLPLELSRGSAITDMRYAIGGEAAIEATLHDAGSALAAYEETIRRAHDPALVRWIEAATLDRYEVAVFQVSRDLPAVVTIAMTLPPATRFVLDPGQTRQVTVDVTLDGATTKWRNVTRARALALPPQPADEPELDGGLDAVFDVEATLAARPVDATASLYAGDSHATRAARATKRHVQLVPPVETWKIAPARSSRLVR